MKRIMLIIALSVLSFLTVSAQDDQKIRKDHTYSTHNYKHPNKAAAARQWEDKRGVAVRTPGFNTGPLANYKHPVPGAVPAGGVVVSHTPETDVTWRNYKIQRVSLPKSTSSSATKVIVPMPGQPVPQTGQ
ncbi:hypothetical protein ACFSUS_15325 [Spirosoma soli]|uniref:Uncharacterized protein n=1 Tax=Spirosoma soli TaxID=1770529 RepID=A0ABW5M5S4_9BACT